jgi:phosphatidylglycerophosphatase C
MSDSPDVAAFDVDGTLTVRDCVRPFLEEVGGRAGLVAAVARRPLGSLRAVAGRDRDLFKEIMVGGVLGGRPVEHVERLGESFAERVAAAWLRADTLARLRWHQSRGDRTVLVSASLGQYLRPLGRRLGVDGVLCAEPRREGGVFGRGLEGANCRRAEKVRRLEEWLVAHGLERAVVWAYGDSSGDTELLSRADHPLWVRDVTVDPVPVGFGPSGSGPSGFGS